MPVAPFYSLFVVVLFVLINQIAGNALLLISMFTAKIDATPVTGAPSMTKK